jgi:hypothetical protein
MPAFTFSTLAFLPRGMRPDVGTLSRAMPALNRVAGALALGLEAERRMLVAVLKAIRRELYARPVNQALTLEEASMCSEIAYGGKAGDLTRDKAWEIPPDGVLSDNLTGFRGVLLQPRKSGDTRIVLAFAGTDPSSGPDLWTDVEQAVNLTPLPPPQYLQADVCAALLQARFKDRLRVTGHSLGGGLANFVSVKRGIPGAGINAAPLGPGSLLHLWLFGAHGRVVFTHYNNKGEFVSTYAPGRQLGEVCVLASDAGVFDGHLLENVDPHAAASCYSE